MRSARPALHGGSLADAASVGATELVSGVFESVPVSGVWAFALDAVLGVRAEVEGYEIAVGVWLMRLFESGELGCVRG